MSDEFDLHESFGNEAEGVDSVQAADAGRFAASWLEDFNPLEALDVAFESPVAALVFLVAGTAFAIIVGVLCFAVHEAFFGGGPPQSLGLK
jgi:hypothetical protein